MSVTFSETRPLYQIGQLLPIVATFSSGSGSGVSPGSVTATVQDGTGTQSTPSVTNEGSGVYSITLSLTSSGTWWVRWVGTSPYQAAYEFSFEVARSVILGE